MRTKIEEYFDGKDTLEKSSSHRSDGGLIVERYKLNCEYHRADGPAYICYYLNGNIEYETYDIKGKVHREDGPAVIRYNEDGSIKGEFFFVNDVKYSNLVLDCPINRELYKGKFIEHGGNLWIKDQNVRND